MKKCRNNKPFLHKKYLTLGSLIIIRDGQYLIVCDILLKIILAIKICLLAIITISLVDDIVLCETDSLFTCGVKTNMAEGGREAEEELVLKWGATTTIWNWFGYRKSDADQTTVIFKVCRKIVVTKSENTSNLFHHLKHKHKPEYEESLKTCCHSKLPKK